MRLYKMVQKFPRTYNQADFNMNATEGDVTVTADKWNKVGWVTVPAQQEIAFGVGAIANGVDSRETATFSLRAKTDVQINGVIRLAVSNANETDIRVIKEDRTENFDDGVKLMETRPKAREDSKLIVYFKPDSSGTVDIDATSQVLLVPVTVYQ